MKKKTGMIVDAQPQKAQKKKRNPNANQRIIDVYKSLKRHDKHIDFNKLLGYIERLKTNDYYNSGDKKTKEFKLLNDIRELPIDIDDKRVLVDKLHDSKIKHKVEGRTCCMNTNYKIKRVRLLHAVELFF